MSEKELPARFADGGDAYQYDDACPGCLALLDGLKRHTRPEAKDKRAAEDAGAEKGRAAMLETVVAHVRRFVGSAEADALEAAMRQHVAGRKS